MVVSREKQLEDLEGKAGLLVFVASSLYRDVHDGLTTTSKKTGNVKKSVIHIIAHVEHLRFTNPSK